MKQLILASQSPRRMEILKKAGYQFVPFPVYVSEIPNKNLSLNEQILDIAERKALAARNELQAKGLGTQNSLILSADTMVCIGNKTLGKPDNEQVAFEYLKLLSGKAHQVKTAIYLLDLFTGNVASHIETTDVYFKSLSQTEIENYIQSKEPLDKAGAYAIQGGGRKFVERFEGDFNNVVGLPLHALENLFKLNSWHMRKTQ